MQDKIFNYLNQELPGVQKNILLKDYTTFKIGGPAEYFFVAASQDDIIRAIKVSKKLLVPIFIFGGGSNLLISDKGIKGLVVKIHSNNDYYLGRGNKTVKAGAGAAMKDLVEFSVVNSLEGLEWAGGLPGTLGGAVRGNAGAFGEEIKDIVVNVKAIEGNCAVKRFSNSQCHFSYRSSIFKEKNFVILQTVLRFKQGDKESLDRVVKSRIEYRKLRHPLEYPNAGSIFKNVALDKFSPSLKEKLLPVVKNDPFPIVPTAYLISQANLKGMKINQAQISEKHPNFIVNLGEAKANDVVGLISVVRKKIKEIYKINLETEVQMVGF